MKTLTLHQPWATLVAIGAKQIETRSWSTAYRGLIAIHAAKNTPVRVAMQAANTPAINAALDDGGIGPLIHVPAGVIVAIAYLAAVSPIVGTGKVNIAGTVHIVNQPELLFGDYTPGRHAWLLPQVVALPFPIPANGHQRLWKWISPNCPICREWLGLPNSGLCQHCHDTAAFNPSILPIRVLKPEQGT